MPTTSMTSTTIPCSTAAIEHMTRTHRCHNSVRLGGASTHRSRTRPLISTVHACVWHGDRNRDRVVINVELPALCSPQFRPGKPSELQQSLCHRINTLAKAYAAAPRPCSISTRINVDLVASDWIGLALDRLWLVSLQSQATGYGRALCA